MATRAIWKGFLKVNEVVCPVALYTAASTSDRIVFHTVNRETGHAVRRIYVDQETGDPVPKEEQAKGYEIGPDEYVIVEPEEIAAAVPRNDKTLDVKGFIPCQQIDDVYFDRPYYLAPADRHALETFALMRDGMKAAKVAALAHAILFRRARSLLVRAYGDGLIATTLSFDYEVRSARDAFSDITPTKTKPQMLELAEHILSTKAGKFDPAEFEDRYEAALGEVVKAKIEGRELPKTRAPKSAEIVDLMTALRESAGVADAAPRTRRIRSAEPTMGKAVKKRATEAGTAKRGSPSVPRRRKAG